MLLILLNILNILISQIDSSTQSVSIKCTNNVTEGELVLKDVTKSNLNQVLHDILKINLSQIHYSKLEFENETDILSSKLQPFVNAVHLAYANHLNLIITPDIIWYLVISGTSTHINNYSEELRSKFVEHEGKKTLSVRRDDFLFNSSSNNWDGVIDEFADKIKQNLKSESRNLFDANFSTTNHVNSMCSKVVLMAAMQEYFSYKLTTLCGIPEIKLLGEKDDWKLIKEKILDLNSTITSLSVWYNQLSDLIQNFIDAFDGNINNDFWDKIYKTTGGSGGPYISGWILALFPYLKNNSKNYFVWEKSWTFAYDINYMSGLVTSDFPIVLTNSSFIWQYLHNEYNMSFISGMVGVRFQESINALQPVFGYGVINM